MNNYKIYSIITGGKYQGLENKIVNINMETNGRNSSLADRHMYM